MGISTRQIQRPNRYFISLPQLKNNLPTPHTFCAYTKPRNYPHSNLQRTRQRSESLKMCRYTRTRYSCGHELELCIPTNQTCSYARCLRTEWVQRNADHSCDICAAISTRTAAVDRTTVRARAVMGDRAAIRTRVAGDGTEDQNTEAGTVRSDYTHPRYDYGNSTGAPSFNPFYGQAGQEHEETYRRNALLAFRRRQDIEQEHWERYNRRHHSDPNTRHSSNEYCDCQYCHTQRRVERNNRQVESNNFVRNRDEEAREEEAQGASRSSRPRSGYCESSRSRRTSHSRSRSRREA